MIRNVYINSLNHVDDHIPKALILFLRLLGSAKMVYLRNDQVRILTGSLRWITRSLEHELARL